MSHEKEIEMKHIPILMLRAVTPAFGILLGLLGLETLDANLLGWFLLVAGIAYAAGSVIVSFVLKRNFWEAQPPVPGGHAKVHDRSSWLLAAGLVAVLCLSPLEFLYLHTEVLHVDWLEIAGACLIVPGIGLFAWARRAPGRLDAENAPVAKGQELGKSAPYRVIRHPASAGLILASFGLVLGYASRWGLLSLLLLLLPAIIWHIHVEERQLSARFGQLFRDYASRTKRLIPLVW
jgi:protein-S-isoprenylcysteine O-methyltransferase Ste14